MPLVPMRFHRLDRKAYLRVIAENTAGLKTKKPLLLRGKLGRIGHENIPQIQRDNHMFLRRLICFKDHPQV